MSKDALTPLAHDLEHGGNRGLHPAVVIHGNHFVGNLGVIFFVEEVCFIGIQIDLEWIDF
jgi:hypothetical protein